MAQGLKDAPVVRTGYRCNNACRFCDQGDLRETVGDHPDDQLLEAAKEAGARAAKARGVVVFSGGEPTLRPELEGWVRAAREAGAKRVIVQTNARMLAYRQAADALVGSGVDIVAVALHGHVPELHDWLTRVPGSFEQTMRGLKNARRAGAHVLLNTVVTRPNMRHLGAIAHLGVIHGARSVRFIWPKPRGEAAALAPSLICDPRMAGPHIDRAVAYVERLGRRVAIDEGDLGLTDYAA